MSFNSNCRILAAELNYRFTIWFIILFYLFIIYFKQRERLQVSVSCSQVVTESGYVNTELQIVVIDYTLTTDNS